MSEEKKPVDIPMKDEDRLKTYAGFADISRRWTSVMDTKAAGLSALNGGLLAFLWGGAKLTEWDVIPRMFGNAATLVALIGLLFALWAITPRGKFSALVGKKSRWEADYKPISFYAYVAKKYGKDEFGKFEADVAKMRDIQFAHEALEQHFNISRVIQTKSEWVFRTFVVTACAIVLAGIGLCIKFWG